MTIPRNFLRWCADAYTVFVLALSTEAFLPVLLSGNDPTDVSKGAPLMRASWALIYAITLVSFMRRRNQGISFIRADIRANKAMAFLVLLTFLSLLWSVDRSLTAHSAAILLLSALVGVDLSIRYTLLRQIQMLCIALGLMICISVVVELLFPGFVPRAQWEGSAWHGVFANKNQLGRMTTLAVAACLALPHRLSWTRGVTIASGVVVGVLAQSASAVGYLAIIVGFFMWFPVLKWGTKQRRIAITISATVALLMICFVSLNLPGVTRMIGKDPTITGRTGLWKMSLAAIQEQPLLGYGWGAFWSKNSISARLIREELNWDAPHSHNGYMEVTLGLGLMGLGAYSVVVGTIAHRGYLFFMSGQESYRRWPLSFLIFISVYQFTESSIVSGDTVYWIMLCCLACSLSQVQERSVSSRAATRELFAGNAELSGMSHG
jgi:exopolysaccharide production protein ExoQ